jgi:hypothetical protein
MPFATIGTAAKQGAAYVFTTTPAAGAIATTAAANSYYTVGATVPITVTFNGAVTVAATTSARPPHAAGMLAVGRAANCDSTSPNRAFKRLSPSLAVFTSSIIHAASMSGPP